MLYCENISLIENINVGNQIATIIGGHYIHFRFQLHFSQQVEPLTKDSSLREKKLRLNKPVMLFTPNLKVTQNELQLIHTMLFNPGSTINSKDLFM